MILPAMSTLPPSKYAPGQAHTLPARTGAAIPLKPNQTITVTNTHGTQVVDFWFLSPSTAPFPTYLSMCHTRASNLHLTPRVGDKLMSNTRAPMLVFAEDTSPAGIHDTLIAACDIYRYRELGVPEGTYHDSCADNFRRAVSRDLGVELGEEVTPPDPLNLWMNIPVVPNPGGPHVDDGNETRNVSVGARIEFERPVVRKGDFVRIRALVEGVVVMSACPQDILNINCKAPMDVEFRVD